MINKHGKEVIAGYHDLGNANKDAHIEKGGYMTNKLVMRSSRGCTRLAVWVARRKHGFLRPQHWGSIIRISVSLL